VETHGFYRNYKSVASLYSEPPESSRHLPPPHYLFNIEIIQLVYFLQMFRLKLCMIVSCLTCGLHVLSILMVSGGTFELWTFSLYTFSYYCLYSFPLSRRLTGAEQCNVMLTSSKCYITNWCQRGECSLWMLGSEVLHVFNSRVRCRT
jgi:hypothetical protein